MKSKFTDPRSRKLVQLHQYHPLAIGGFVFLAVLIAAFMWGCSAFVKLDLKNAPPDAAADRIEKHLDYCYKKLHLGMARSEALALLPRPHNTNTQNVCVWIMHYSQEVQGGTPLDWQRLHRVGGGYFVVFVNGKLATPLCATAAFDPWQALQDYAKMSHDGTEQILGPRS